MSDQLHFHITGTETEDETLVSLSGPAPLANRFFIKIGAGSARISFTEQAPNQKTHFFRSAVTLSISDAEQLNNVLGGLIEQHKKQT